MRFLSMVTMLAAVVGCAISRLSSDVQPYVGRDVHELAKRLGKPMGIRETSGDRVYVWSVDSEGVLPTGSGTEGTRTATTIAHYECTLEVTVNAQDSIRDYQIEGSNAGCAAFRRHLGSP
jgi:hypothetical protein